MSYERDKGDEAYTDFKFKEAFHYYLIAREKFFTMGKDVERRQIDSKISRCFLLLGRKKEALDLLLDNLEEIKDLLLFSESLNVLLDIVTVHFTYGDFVSGKEILDTIHEDDIPESDYQLYFKYWQLIIQFMISYHELDPARDKVLKLMEKAKGTGNEPYYHELQILLAQIDAEKGNVMEAYSNIDESLKYFESTPFERSAFEKKIILSQFIEEPEETIKLIDEYMEKYKTDDIHPVFFNAQKIELELRASKVTPQVALEKMERVLCELRSIEMKELEAKIFRMISGLYHFAGQYKTALTTYMNSRQYYKSQKMRYEEALSFFVFIPSLIHLYSIKILAIYPYEDENDQKTLVDVTDQYLKDNFEEAEKVFIEFNDIIKAKMTKFFALSFAISDHSQPLRLKETVDEMKDIYQWMIDNGEIHFSEMIGQYIEIVDKFPGAKKNG